MNNSIKVGPLVFLFVIMENFMKRPVYIHTIGISSKGENVYGNIEKGYFSSEELVRKKV